MKKILIGIAIVGGIFLIGMLSVEALSNHHEGYVHHNYVNTNANKVIQANCGNYIDTNNDGLCDNCTNYNGDVTKTHHHYNHHGHH